MRMNAGTLMLGVVSVMFGLLGAYVVRKELHRTGPISPVATPKSAELQTVPVAGVPLEAGRMVSKGDIVILKMSPQQMRDQNISGNFMPNVNQIIGRVLKREIREGSPFDTPDFYPEGTGPSVADRLKKGYRAVTVNVSQDSAVAGFAVPGSMVDVLFRAESAKDDDNRETLPEVTVTLIEAAQVLAFNRDTAQVVRVNGDNSNSSAQSASVTLAVTPAQAAALRVADGRGLMSLALRHQDDLEPGIGVLPPRTLDDLLDRTNSRHKMEIYRGRHMSQTSFKNNERLTPTEAPLLADPAPPQVPVTQTTPNPQPSVIIVSPRGTVFAGGGGGGG